LGAKKSSRGRPPGAAPGSGQHERDAKWRAAGYVTIAEAAAAIGFSRKTLYKRIQEGRWKAGVDYVKAWPGRNGTVYVKLAAVEALKAQVQQPPAVA